MYWYTFVVVAIVNSDINIHSIAAIAMTSVLGKF